MTHLEELPAWLDCYEDVQPPTTTRLDERLGTPHSQHLRQRLCSLYGVAEVAPLLRVEIDTQFVGSIDVVPGDGPRVEGDGAEVGGPDDRGDVGRAHLHRSAPGREGDADMVDEVGHGLRKVLVVEGLLPLPIDDDPVGEALQGRGAVAKCRQ